MGCATSLVKYLVFFFNLAFVLAGIAFIAIGVIFKLNIEELTTQLDKVGIPFSLAPTLLIIVGCVIFVIAFFGCCGAIRENTCMLGTFAVILLVIFILQVGLAVYAFIQYKDTNSEIISDIKKGIKDAMNAYPSNEQDREAIDALQYNLKCCGVNGPTDWLPIFQNGSVPSSCCDNLPQICYPTSAFHHGCGDDLFNFLKKAVIIIGGVVIGIAVVELLGAIIALCLSSSIRNHERRGQYA